MRQGAPRSPRELQAQGPRRRSGAEPPVPPNPDPARVPPRGPRCGERGEENGVCFLEKMGGTYPLRRLLVGPRQLDELRHGSPLLAREGRHRRVGLRAKRGWVCGAGLSGLRWWWRLRPCASSPLSLSPRCCCCCCCCARSVGKAGNTPLSLWWSGGGRTEPKRPLSSPPETLFAPRPLGSDGRWQARRLAQTRGPPMVAPRRGPIAGSVVAAAFDKGGVGFGPVPGRNGPFGPCRARARAVWGEKAVEPSTFVLSCGQVQHQEAEESPWSKCARERVVREQVCEEGKPPARLEEDGPRSWRGTRKMWRRGNHCEPQILWRLGVAHVTPLSNAVPEGLSPSRQDSLTALPESSLGIVIPYTTDHVGKSACHRGSQPHPSEGIRHGNRVGG